MQQTNRNKRDFAKELTPEEKFELMIKKWKKESVDRLKDINKGKNRKIPDKRYSLSPYRFLEGN
jgi:hypothetical protein